jgi:hypothetical protein
MTLIGNITTNQTEILQTEVAYYKKLYSSQTTNETDIEQYLSNTPVEAMQTLNDNESETCNGQLSIQECTDALENMKLNKSPGIDGLSAEFYQAF